MLEKMMHKSENMLQKGARMGAEIEKISIKMEVQKKYGFLVHRPRTRRWPRDRRWRFWGVPISTG